MAFCEICVANHFLSWTDPEQLNKHEQHDDQWRILLLFLVHPDM